MGQASFSREIDRGLEGQSDQKRIALIIGNSHYQSRSLRNPVNDAQDIARTLRNLGFSVMLKTDANQAIMESAINAFAKKLRRGVVGLFYYSGHGVQYQGNNYLIPIGAISSIYSAEQLKYKTVNTGYVLGAMANAGNKLNIVILDACRDNPFKGFSRGLQRGLARVQKSEAEGTLIAYATSPGNTASDGYGRNSPYTKHLLRLMPTPNLPIELLFKKVRVAVKRETGGRQSPWYEASIEGDFSFVRTRQNITPSNPTNNPLFEGYQFLKAGEWRKAERQFNQAARKNPRSVEPWYWKAELALARGHKQVSINYLNQVLKQKKTHIHSLALKMKVLLLLGGRNIKKAKQLGSRIYKHHPSQALKNWVICLKQVSGFIITATDIETQCQSQFPVYQFND